MATGYVYSGGTREDPFAEVDLLFSEKKYEEAILILNDILDEYPELFDEIQQRNEVYLGVQQEISNLEEGIIEDIKNENPEGIFDKINAIRQLNPQPNEYRAAVLDDYLYEAAIIVNKARVDEIMDEALPLARSGDYWGAVALYMTGLEIGRDIFEESGYGTFAVDGVASLKSGVRSAADKFDGIRGSFEESVTAFNASFREESVTALSTGADGLYTSLKNLARVRSEVKSYDTVLQDIRSGLRLQRDDNRDIAYLRYLREYLTGREDVDQEGFLSLLDLLWKETYTSAESRMSDYFANAFDAALSDYESGNWNTAAERFNDVVSIAPVMSKIASLATTYVLPGPDYALTDDDRALLNTAVDETIFARGRERISNEYISAIPLLEQAGTLTGLSDTSSVGLLQSRRRQIETTLDAFETSLTSAEIEGSYFRELESAGVDAADETTLFTDLETRLSDAVASLRDKDVTFAARIAATQVEELIREFDPIAGRIDEGAKLVEGILTSSAGLEVSADAADEVRSQAILKKYPDQGRVILLEARSDLNGVRRNTTTVLTTLENDKQYVLSDGRMQPPLDAGDDLSEDIDELVAHVGDLIALASEEIRLADAARENAYQYISDATQSIEAEDFTGARAFLTAASGAALESISHRQDDEFAFEIDASVASLTTEINAALVRIVVEEVDALVSSAQQSYGRQEYESAEGSLLQAQSRWASVYSEPDFYIEYYLSLVQTALSVQTGREIPQTDSLYREMRQYLNYALADYKEAERLLSAQDRIGAQRKLDEVSNNLRIVLQQYPYNEEANILNWRITKIEDIDKYNRDIRDAVNSARIEVNTPAAADAYSELQTIKKLEPGYPGLDELIFEAEINLGLRAAPQTVERRNLALELYNEALDLYNTGDLGRFDDALDRLNQALVINPAYADARGLRNTINSEKGGTIATTLSSSEDMQFYLQAVKLVGDDRTEQALLIIRRLWNNEANRNYKALVDLKATVERSLGVQ